MIAGLPQQLQKLENIVSLRIKFEFNKTRTRKTPNMDTFHAAMVKFTNKCHANVPFLLMFSNFRNYCRRLAIIEVVSLRIQSQCRKIRPEKLQIRTLFKQCNNSVVENLMISIGILP